MANVCLNLLEMNLSTSLYQRRFSAPLKKKRHAYIRKKAPFRLQNSLDQSGPYVLHRYSLLIRVDRRSTVRNIANDTSLAWAEINIDASCKTKLSESIMAGSSNYINVSSDIFSSEALLDRALDTDKLQHVYY